MSNQKIDMINGGIVKKIILFTIPIMLQSILQSLYNSADLIIVGQFSGDNAEAALSSIGATSSIFNVLVGVFIGLSAGVDVTSSFYNGMNDKKGLKQIIDTSIITAPIIGVIVTVMGIFLSRPVLVIMNTPEADGVLNGAVLYLQIIMLGIPFSMVYNFCAAILRTSGETQKPFIYLAISGLVNVLLNMLFVAVFKWGVVGVAVATVISQVLSSAMIFIHLMINKGTFSFSFKNIDFSRSKLLKIIKVGIPAGIQSSVFSLSNAFLQSGVNSFGKDAMAGSTAVATVESLMWVTLTSFQNALTTFISQNIGAGKIERVNKILYATLAMTIGLGVVIGLGMFALGRPVISIFIKDSPAAMEYAYDRLKITFPFYFMAGMMGVMPGAIRGLGYSTPPSVISIIGACGVRILWIYTVFRAFPSISVLYLVHPITWVITSVSLVINYIICYKLVKKRILLSRKTQIVEQI